MSYQDYMGLVPMATELFKIANPDWKTLHWVTQMNQIGKIVFYLCYHNERNNSQFN